MMNANDLQVRYVVVNENTFGYMYNAEPNLFAVLRESLLKGGYTSPMATLDGPRLINPTDVVRDAVAADFVEYRCMPPRDFQTGWYPMFPAKG